MEKDRQYSEVKQSLQRPENSECIYDRQRFYEKGVIIFSETLYRNARLWYDFLILSARSSVDRALASGAKRVGSIPIGRIF